MAEAAPYRRSPGHDLLPCYKSALSACFFKLQSPSMKQNNLPGTQPAEPEQPIAHRVILEAWLCPEDEMFHVTVSERHFALAELLPPLPVCLFIPVPL